MRRSIALIVSLLIAAPAAAQSPSAQLNQCLADKTTGKDRKDLARWFVSAMVAHPDIRDLSNLTPGTAENTSQAVGQLVTRLFTQDCANEAKASFAAEGPDALDKSFETLGQLAMTELMLNADVRAAMLLFQRYVDNQKMNATLSGK